MFESGADSATTGRLACAASATHVNSRVLSARLFMLSIDRILWFSFIALVSGCTPDCQNGGGGGGPGGVSGGLGKSLLDGPLGPRGPYLGGRIGRGFVPFGP